MSDRVCMLLFFPTQGGLLLSIDSGLLLHGCQLAGWRMAHRVCCWKLDDETAKRQPRMGSHPGRSVLPQKDQGQMDKERLQKRYVLHEPEPEEAECEITDLDPHKKGSRALNRLLHGHRLSFGTRLWMALLSILGAALFSWLLMSPLHLAGVPQFEKASN